MNRRTALAALAALLAITTTACGKDDEPTTEPSVTPSPTATSSKPATPQDQAVDDATAALDRWFAVANQLGQDPKAPLSQAKTVAISTALGYTEQLYRVQREQGLTQVGDATYEIDKILDVSLDNSNPKKGLAPTVKFQICWDITDVDVVDKAGNSQVTSDRMDRSVATYFVTNYDYAKDPHGGWKVSSFQRKMERPC